MFRAKLKVDTVLASEYSDEVVMRPVTSGTPEDNSYSQATPSGEVKLTINNPTLRGKIKPGQVFYADFTPVPVPVAGA